ncbi:MAG: hypothetical protein NZ770_06515 [Candidatus Poseidoniaceae archaeon]|nr:hypothetical protein [Candidatus Poseidoniaceae archaeon]
MDGVVREGERIPRRPLPEFEEVDSSALAGIMSGGLLKVAMEDTNQFGPHAMIILLVIMATVTGVLLKVFSLF